MLFDLYQCERCSDYKLSTTTGIAIKAIDNNRTLACSSRSLNQPALQMLACCAAASSFHASVTSLLQCRQGY